MPTHIQLVFWCAMVHVGFTAFAHPCMKGPNRAWLGVLPFLLWGKILHAPLCRQSGWLSLGLEGALLTRPTRGSQSCPKLTSPVPHLKPNPRNKHAACFLSRLPVCNLNRHSLGARIIRDMQKRVTIGLTKKRTNCYEVFRTQEIPMLYTTSSASNKTKLVPTTGINIALLNLTYSYSLETCKWLLGHCLQQGACPNHSVQVGDCQRGASAALARR